eukprot:1158310-Pelagomonas_calceolata.AAC.12
MKNDLTSTHQSPGHTCTLQSGRTRFIGLQGSGNRSLNHSLIAYKQILKGGSRQRCIAPLTGQKGLSAVQMHADIDLLCSVHCCHDGAVIMLKQRGEQATLVRMFQ